MDEKISEIRRSRTKAFIDIFIIAGFTISVFVCVLYFNVSGIIFSLLKTNEETLIDEFGVTSIALVLALSVFSMRRWRELKLELTVRKRAEEKLRDSERLLAEAQHLASIGSWNWDLQSKYLSWSTEHYRLLGLNPQEFTPSYEGLLKHIHPDDLDLFTGIVGNSLRTHEPFSLDLRIIQPDGEMRILNSRGNVISNEQGNSISMFGTLQDVTELKSAEKALRETEERLQQSQKMESIGTMAGGVAHDFNNLLTVISGNTQLVLAKLDPDSRPHQRLVEIERAVDRAETLVRQMLAFSRRQQLERKTINLNDTISEFLKLMRRTIGADVDMRFQAADNLSAVFADPAQIEQVVMNLVVNARDAMPQGGRLTIETNNALLDEAFIQNHPLAEPGSYAQITVSDTGMGMDAETQKQIFEPFFTTKDVGKGTGLGLSMVFGIVKQHNGLIEVSSLVGKGTTFNIYLPVDEKSVVVEESIVQPTLRGGTETVLVAEDEESLRKLTRGFLEELGYTVLLARDGAEAMELYTTNSEQINMLILDVVMPRMGGQEVYEQIRSSGSDVPVIFMTGYSSEMVQSQFIEKTGAVLLGKPYNVEVFGRKVRETLDATSVREIIYE
jgi:PAS domain S-box-containing protein